MINYSIFIREWKSESRNVNLFREENNLAFSVGGRNGVKSRFIPLNNIDVAINITLLFQNTIAANLKEEEPNPSCFIPLLFAEAGAPSKAQIALFGRVTLSGQVRARWGIFYPSTQTEQVLEIRDLSSQEFVRWCPPSYKLSQEQQPLENNSDYIKRFSQVIDCQNNGNITQISLKYQRSWYESNGQSCAFALKNYLIGCALEPLQTLKQLGLAPEQIVSYCTEIEWSYFRILSQQLNDLPINEQDIIFNNLEKSYPTIFPTLLKELMERNAHQPSENHYQSILTALKKEVFGQDTAAEFLANALNSQKQSRLREDHQKEDKAVFLFVGPTGVGKTEIAKVAASLKQNRFVKFNMEQFKGEVDVNKLFGSPPGYVGCTDLPLLAKELEKYASPLIEGSDSIYKRTVTDVIIVFDEFEKAHSNVKQSLLNLFDELYCKVQYTQDKKNYIVKYVFKKCIFIGTTNLYKDEILEDFSRNMEPHAIEAHFKKLNQIKPTLQSFSPELLGRMKPVAFGPVPKGDVYHNLIRSKLPSILTSLQNSVACRSVEISNDVLSEVIRLLAAKLYGDGTGIRNIIDYFEKEVQKTIYKQSDWNNLSDKVIKIVPDEGKLGLKCTAVVFGKVTREYPLVII